MQERDTAITSDANAAGDHSSAIKAASAPIYPPTPQGAQPPFTLPPDLPTFAGREDLLQALDGALHPGGQTAVSVVVLGGIAGVGKSALAVHAAHRWRDRFPDGVIWADLRAQTGACDALRHVAGLYGYREQAAQLGDDVRALAGLMRTILHDKRALLLIDNAEGLPADELDRLLPDAPGPVTVITRRRAFPALERVGLLLRVDVMDEEETLALLGRLVGQETVEAGRETCRALAERLRYLPLALDIAGRCMRERGWGPAEMLRRLEQAADRPATLGLPVVERPEGSVLPAFALSYDGLDEPDRELFRALSAFALAGFTPRAAGAVLGREGEEKAGVERALGRLEALSLIRQAEVEGRYDLYPLLRDCAQALAERAGERERWARRHARYFTRLADWSGRQLRNPETALRAAAMAAVERANLLAAQQTCLARESWDAAVNVAYRLDELFERTGHWVDRRRALEAGIEAARKGKRRHDEAGLAHNLGLLAQRQGDFAEARRRYGEALDIARQLGNRASVAVTLYNLGLLAQKQGEYAEAGRLYEQATETFEQLGDRAGVARTLHQLGNVAYQQGDYAEARRQYGEALDVRQQLGDRAGVAATTSQMGTLAYLLGKVEQARRLHRQSLALRRELGDNKGIAEDLHQLGRLAEDEGNTPEARRLYGEALETMRQLGDRAGVAQTLRQLGRLVEEDGDLEEAELFLAESLATLEALGSPDASITRRLLERVRGKLERRPD
jgi:tetratricopeptide (TPR) repeat protein